MVIPFEDLRVLQAAEAIADDIWRHIVGWGEFAKDVVGKQLAHAADSIGANIAEAFGRFHFGEKIQFLYYARGSLFETKYWLNRTQARELMSATEVQNCAFRLTDLARQLNAFAGSLKSQRHRAKDKSSEVHEPGIEYQMGASADAAETLFSAADLAWLQSGRTGADL